MLSRFRQLDGVAANLLRSCSVNPSYLFGNNVCSRDAPTVLPEYVPRFCSSSSANDPFVNSMNARARGDTASADAQSKVLSTLQTSNADHAVASDGFAEFHKLRVMGKIDQAVEELKSLRQRGIKIKVSLFNMLIDHCNSSEKILLTKLILATMRGMGLYANYFTCVKFIEVCRNQNNMQVAFDCWDHLISKNFQPNEKIYTMFINGCTMNKELTLAVDLFFKLIETTIPSEWICVDLILACSRFQRHKTSVQIVRWMLDHGVPIRTRTLNAALKSALCSHKLGSAISIFSELTAKGVIPDVVSYNTLISTAAASKKPSKCNEYFARMIAEGIAPDGYTYSAMIKAYSHAKDLDKVLEIVRQMKDTPLEVQTSATREAIHLCLSEDRISDAEELLRDMIERGSYVSQSIFREFLKYHKLKGSMSEMLRCFEDMRKMGMVPNRGTYTMLIQSCQTAEELETAYKTLQKTTDEKSVGPGLAEMAYDAYVRALKDLGASDAEHHLSQIAMEGVLNKLEKEKAK